jgi:hypothetical protein
MLTMAQRHLGVRMPDQVWAELSGVLPDPALVVTATDFLLEDAANLAGTSEAAAALLRLDSHTQRLRHIAHQLVKPAETRPGADRSEGLRSVPALITRAAGLARRHGGWLWRASREPHSPVRTALEKRQVLAAWIRGD